jgi:hemolysin activation/secretion protein
MRERFQQLLDDPLFRRLNARLMPDATPGLAVLEVDVERAPPYGFSIFFNNGRSPSIGAESAGLQGVFRNLSGRGDTLEASFGVATAAGWQDSVSLDWTLPLGQRGMRLALHVDHGLSAMIEEPFAALGLKSLLDTRQVGLRHAVVDGLRRKLELGVDYQHRKNRSTLDGQPFSFIANEPTGTSRVESWRFWQEFSQRAEDQVLALRSTFVGADTNLLALAVEQTLAAGRMPDPRYAYWVGQLSYARLFREQGLRLGLRLAAQFTVDRLLALDGLALGGMHSVRGYRENQVIRDNGVIANLELEYPLPASRDWGLLTLVPFLDYGRGWDSGEGETTLSSAGIALRHRHGGWSGGVAWGKRLRRPQAEGTNAGGLQDKGLHFAISYDFAGR